MTSAAEFSKNFKRLLLLLLRDWKIIKVWQCKIFKIKYKIKYVILHKLNLSKNGNSIEFNHGHHAHWWTHVTKALYSNEPTLSRRLKLRLSLYLLRTSLNNINSVAASVWMTRQTDCDGFPFIPSNWFCSNSRSSWFNKSL
jgi:hypothetical protein